MHGYVIDSFDTTASLFLPLDLWKCFAIVTVGGGGDVVLEVKWSIWRIFTHVCRSRDSISYLAEASYNLSRRGRELHSMNGSLSLRLIVHVEKRAFMHRLQL